MARDLDIQTLDGYALPADVLQTVQAPPQPVIDRGVVVELVKGMGRVTEQQKIDRAALEAMERDDEEALIMILLEAA